MTTSVIVNKQVSSAQEYQTTPLPSALGPTLTVRMVDNGERRAAILRQPNMSLGRVVENRVLTSSVRTKRHIGALFRRS